MIIMVIFRDALMPEAGSFSPDADFFLKVTLRFSAKYFSQHKPVAVVKACVVFSNIFITGKGDRTGVRHCHRRSVLMLFINPVFRSFLNQSVLQENI